jgi:membrane protein
MTWSCAEHANVAAAGKPIHPLQIPWRGWYDIVWRTYREMQSDRLLSIAGGVSFFVLLAIFPAITALVSAYGLFFSPSTIINNLSLLNEVMPDNVLNIVHEQASRIQQRQRAIDRHCCRHSGLAVERHERR